MGSIEKEFSLIIISRVSSIACVLLLGSVQGCSCSGTSGDSSTDDESNACGNHVVDDDEECDYSVSASSTRYCATSCGTAGTQSCTTSCVWGDCTAQEICGNDIDENCNSILGRFITSDEIRLGSFWLDCIIYNGTNFGVVGTNTGFDGSNIGYSSYATNGSEIVPSVLLSSTVENDYNIAGCAEMEGIIMISWVDIRNTELPSGTTDIYYALLSESGVTILTDSLLSTFDLPVAVPAVHAMGGTSDKKFVVTWYYGNDLHMAQVAMDGSITLTDRFVLAGNRSTHNLTVNRVDDLTHFWQMDTLNFSRFNSSGSVLSEGTIEDTDEFSDSSADILQIPDGYVLSCLQTDPSPPGDSDVSMLITDINGTQICPTTVISADDNNNGAPNLISFNGYLGIVFSSPEDEVVEDTSEYTDHIKHHYVILAVTGAEMTEIGEYYEVFMYDEYWRYDKLSGATEINNAFYPTAAIAYENHVGLFYSVVRDTGTTTYYRNVTCTEG